MFDGGCVLRKDLMVSLSNHEVRSLEVGRGLNLATV
jgi:hypothetical protein